MGRFSYYYYYNHVISFYHDSLTTRGHRFSGRDSMVRPLCFSLLVAADTKNIYILSPLVVTKDVSYFASTDDE